MSILQELTKPETIEVPLMEAFNTAIQQLDLGTKAGRVNVKGLAKNFFKQNSALSIMAASLAVNSYVQMKAGNRNTIKLYAKDSYEKRMITDVVDSLLKSGRYKLAKTRYALNGQYWELVRYQNV